jgi:sugar phosphate isomerase/epimerase
MKISIASYAFHGLLRDGMMDVFGYLETCRYRYGLHAADIWNGFLQDTSDGFLRKVKEGLNEREMVLVNLCVDGCHLWEDDPVARERNRNRALEYLNAAEVLGARTIRIDAGGRGDAFTPEAFDFVVNLYRQYAQRAYDNGYRVGPENHWGPERVPANMKRLFEAVDHPGFGLLLHITGWTSDDPDAADAMAAPFTMHTHVAWNVTETCLEEKMKMLLAAGYDGYWGVEHHTGRDEFTEVGIQVAKVRDVLGRIRVSG